MSDLLELAIKGHGGLRRWQQFSRFRVAGPAVHYPSAYREFGGIMVPTRRRVYVRRPDGSPGLDPVSVVIDFSHVAFF